MAKPNYGFEKRQREIAKKKKQEEKRLRKLAEKEAQSPTTESPDPSSPATLPSSDTDAGM